MPIADVPYVETDHAIDSLPAWSLDKIGNVEVVFRRTLDTGEVLPFRMVVSKGDRTTLARVLPALTDAERAQIFAKWSK